jgi:hypothetical protein
MVEFKNALRPDDSPAIRLGLKGMAGPVTLKLDAVMVIPG